MKSLLDDLRALAISSLRRMYRPEQNVFSFRLRRHRGNDVLEGVSRRYTAMVLLGLAGESADAASEVLHGATMEDVCRHHLATIDSVSNLGDVACMIWAGRVLGLDVTTALSHMTALAPTDVRHPTVEQAWALTALSVKPGIESGLAERLAKTLGSAYNETSRIFAHQATSELPWHRRHVACFADLVYPTIALALHGVAQADDRALRLARSCAEGMCDNQGREGQWWWHFDVRSGDVIEGYPVYAVHQDAMAPMALFAVRECCQSDHDEAIARGLQWLVRPQEIDQSLIDWDFGVVWRKVARREPGKLSRAVQAAASAVNRGWRAPGLNTLFKPRFIDFETRPYHMGWLLYAWSAQRVVEFDARLRGKENAHTSEALADLSSV